MLNYGTAQPSTVGVKPKLKGSLKKAVLFAAAAIGEVPVLIQVKKLKNGFRGI